MFTESMAPPSKSGVFAAARFGPGSGVNIFRDAWQYRITEAGAARLAARKGASPAFLSILGIAGAGAVTFGQIARQMPKIAGDDLELWLSAMCTMGLLAPVEGDEPAIVARTGMPDKAAAAEVDPAPAPAGLALLVHADAKTRAHWRRALTGRGFDLLEAADLESVEGYMRARRPAWVVLGLKGEDFEGLHLLRALKRPRAPRVSRVCLVVPRGRTLTGDEGETAARADATATSVADIVRALCGEAALAPAMEQQIPDPVTLPASSVPDVAEDAVVAVAKPPGAAPATPPANAPVWMNLLYGDAYQYGSFETDFPSHLESQYPRLLVRMIENWARPEFEREINRLILDDRGDRHGFPPEVMDELWFLNQIHQLRDAPEGPQDVTPATAQAGERQPLEADGLLNTSRLSQWMTSHKGG
jgi:hypothetical protein